MLKNRQEDIYLLQIGAEVNDMKFIGSKFLILIHVNNEETKGKTIYFIGDIIAIMNQNQPSKTI